MTTDIFSRLTKACVAELSTRADGAVVEERYWSLRQQVPIVYLLGLVNVSAMEVAVRGRVFLGFNLPTFILLCGKVRLWHWFGPGTSGPPTHELMVRRMRQTFVYACLVCIGVCARSLYLLEVGDATSQMAVMLFAGLTGIGVAYGLTALPAAGLIPLILIIGPISVTAFASREPHFAGAAFGLVAVAILTMRLLGVHGRHFNRVVRSRSDIAREQELAEDARYEAVVAATTDFLTGMPNRRAFVAALDVATSGGAECFAVALLDLDRFKAVNDTFGHTVGDQLLQEVAKKLLSALGSRGMVARLGGDEFGILLPSVRRAKDASAVGAELLTAISGPVIIQGREFVISGSCGMAISERRDEQSPSRLLADADLALYQAKENPGCGPAIFKLCMEAPRRRRAQIERALRLPSLAQNLGMVFQPIFDVESGQVTAIEALARWTDPELGRVGPSEFVPIAEQLNLIDGINQHLMGLAFEAAQTWPDHVKLAFNLSAVQLCSRGSAKAVLRALAAARLSPRRLQVEVTETALLADFERARENLTQLRQAGAAIVLDDFGAGYASIGYLRELQFDQIKLDGGLVTAAQHSTDGKRLLRAVVGLCEILGVATVAEHVEGPEALDLVTDLGCVCGQGFWLAVPMIAADLRSRLHTLCLPTAPCRQAA